MNCIRPQHIRNPYTGEYLTVSCRNCETCAVENSQRISFRIMNHVDYLSNGLITYFITLTYSDEFIPNVRCTECSNGIPNIYRGRSFEVLPYQTKDSRKLTYSDESVTKYINDSRVFRLRSFEGDSVGVLYFRDFQLFMKRLHKYFNVRNIRHNFSHFVSAEYGETTYRPHFHVLLTCSLSYEVLKTAVMACWQYCDYNKISEKWFQVSHKTASYLGSYVCDGYNLPPFYKLPVWRQKKSHSNHYGFNNPSFSLSNFYDSASKGSCTYHQSYYDRSGNRHEVDVSYPDYVRYRYFTSFKGFARLALNEFLFLAKKLTGEIVDTSANAYDLPLGFSKSLLCLYSIYQKLGFNSEDDVEMARHAFLRMLSYTRQLKVSFTKYLVTAWKYNIVQFSYRLRKIHEDDQSFIHSFRNYHEIPVLISSLTYVDEDGQYLYDQIKRYHDSYVHPRVPLLLSRFENNKNLKKIKFRSIDFYGLKSDYYNIAYGT